MISASSIRAFWRARTRLEKTVALLAALSALIELFRARGLLAGLVEFLAVLAGFALAIRYVRRALLVLMWRLRHRLLITYLFIGVVPVLLLLTMAALAAYIFYGQVATYLVGTEVERVKQELRLAARAAAYDVDQARAGGRELGQAALIELVRMHLPPRLADLQIEVALPRQRPPWIDKEFCGLVVIEHSALLRAAMPLGRGALMAGIPVDGRLVGSLAPGIGAFHFMLATGEATDLTPDQRQQIAISSDWVRVGERLYDRRGGVQAGVMPPPANRLDFVVQWAVAADVIDWNTGKAALPALLVVYSRPSLLNARLFPTLGEFSQAAPIVLGGIAVAFLFIEVFSLLIGVGLTRSMTRAIADLYEGTLRLHAGDLTWRIPVRSRDQLASLAESFNTMTASIKQLIEEQKEKQRLQLELDVARDVQANLFPKEVPTLNRLELMGSCSPARSVSGDYYDFVPLDERNLALVIGDVAGKGISAALMMAGLQSMLHTQFDLTRDSLVRRAVAGDGGSTAPPAADAVAALVGQLNRQLYRQITKGRFATFFCGLYDDDTGELTYTNAGHPPPMILRDGALHRLEKGGVVLGIFPGARYQQETVSLQPGDLFLLFTDGITEPENSYGEEFGEQRLLALIGRNAHRPAAEIVEAVMSAVREWTGSPELQDDMTVVVARRR
jgi:sigma-B regulation protein RsbU (phosphoserine phosphatase)